MALFNNAALIFYFLGIATVAFNGVRAAPEVAVCDVFFLSAICIFFLVALIRGRVVVLPYWYLLSACCFVLSSLCAFFENYDGQDLLVLLRLLFAMVGIPWVIRAASFGSETCLYRTVMVWQLSSIVCACLAVTDSFGLTAVGDLVVGRDYLGRYRSLTAHPNHLAIVIVMALPILVLLNSYASSNLKKAIMSIGIVISLWAVNLTGSRAGVVVAIVILAISYLRVSMRHNNSIPLYVVLMGLVGGGVLFVFGVSDGMLDVIGGNDGGALSRVLGYDSTSGDSDEDRLVRYSSAVEMFYQSPFWGGGLSQVRYAHNIYLQVIHAAGLIGAIGLLLMFGGMLLFSVRGFFSAKTSFESDAYFSILLSLLAWMLVGMVQNPLYDRFLYVPVGLLFSFRMKCWKYDLV